MTAKRKQPRSKNRRAIRHLTQPPGKTGTLDEIHIDPPYDVGLVDVMDLLKTTRVLFYPASGSDWRPLRYFSVPGRFDCQTILYCDWHRDCEKGFAAQIKSLPVELECESETVITPEQITQANTAAPLSFLRDDERERYQQRYRDFSTRSGWGRWIVLRGRLGNGDVRRLNFIFLGAEGVATYLQVFNQQRVAPFMLCTVGCGAGFGYNWTDFRVYAEALGRAVESNPSKPMYVVNEGGEPYDWPWNEEVHAVDGMRVFKRPDQAGSKSNPASPTVPKKYPNPFRRRFPPGKKVGPMPKPKMGFGFFGCQADPGNADGQTKSAS